MRQALRCRRAKRPAGTGCLPVQADDTARLAGRGTGSRLPGNPGMAGHGHASDRSPPPPEERQPPDRAQPHHSPRLPASFPGPTSNKPRRSRISADRSSRMTRVTTRELFRRFMVLLVPPYTRPGPTSRSGLPRPPPDLRPELEPAAQARDPARDHQPDRPAGQPRRPAGRQPRR